MSRNEGTKELIGDDDDEDGCGKETGWTKDRKLHSIRSVVCMARLPEIKQHNFCGFSVVLWCSIVERT